MKTYITYDGANWFMFRELSNGKFTDGKQITFVNAWQMIAEHDAKVETKTNCVNQIYLQYSFELK